jgi:hypothetical protein
LLKSGCCGSIADDHHAPITGFPAPGHLPDLVCFPGPGG